MTTHKGVWVRFAASSARLRGRDSEKRYFRCFIGDSKEEIPLSRLIVEGLATPRNHLTEADPDLQDGLGMVAWVRYFGDLTVSGSEASITLRDPN